MVSLALSALRLVDADGCGDALHDALSGFNLSGLISSIEVYPFNPGHLRGFDFAGSPYLHVTPWIYLCMASLRCRSTSYV